MLFQDLLKLGTGKVLPIENFPDLLISDQGRVFNKDTGKEYKPSFKYKQTPNSFCFKHNKKVVLVYKEYMSLFGFQTLRKLGFKPIPFSTYYWISTQGEVFYNKTLKFTFGRKTPYGYKIISLPRKDKTYSHRYIHSLLMTTHCDPDPDPSKIYVNHKDGNKQNNQIRNLEWTNHKENGEHYFRELGGVSGRKGKLGLEHNKCQPLKATKGSEQLYFESYNEAERKGFNRQGIRFNVQGKYKQHKGYIWEHITVEDFKLTSV